MYSISIGPLTLTAYSLSVGLALAAGLGTLWWVSSRRGLDAGLALDAALGGLLLGVVAGRGEAILTSIDYFLERPSLAFCLRQGGLGARTLTAVLTITFLVVVRRGDGRWRLYASALTPAAALAAAILWAGALLWGGFAGEPTGSFVALTLPDRYGVMAPRLPLQALMALAHLAFALSALTFLEHKLPPGSSLAAWGASTSALAALLGSFRSEQTAFTAGLSSSVAADLGLTFAWVSFGILLYVRYGANPAAPEDPYIREV